MISVSRTVPTLERCRSAQLTGRAGALDDLAAQVRELMPFLLAPVAA